MFTKVSRNIPQERFGNVSSFIAPKTGHQAERIVPRRDGMLDVKGGKVKCAENQVLLRFGCLS